MTQTLSNSGPQTAMVLAAGLGTRMRPLTDDRPKALVTVAGRTLIDHMLDRLVAVGVRKAIVNVHYFADTLEAHLKGRTDLEIVISDERDQLLETGGGLVRALPLLGEEPIWVANIDSLWTEHQPALSALSAAWDPNRMDALMLVAPVTQCLGYDGAGDFHLTPDVYDPETGELAFRGAAPSAPYAHMGVHILKPQALIGRPEAPWSLADLWRQQAANGRAWGIVLDGFWMHVGDPVAREAAEARLADLKPIGG